MKISRFIIEKSKCVCFNNLFSSKPLNLKCNDLAKPPDKFRCLDSNTFSNTAYFQSRNSQVDDLFF